MSDITAAIRKRITEIDRELKNHPLQRERATLERALAELDGKSSAKAPMRRSSARRPSKRRAARGERRQQVLDHLKEHPGARPAEIARAIGASPNQVHGIITKLRDEKSVAKSGKGYKLRSARAKSAAS